MVASQQGRLRLYERSLKARQEHGERVAAHVRKQASAFTPSTTKSHRTSTTATTTSSGESASARVLQPSRDKRQNWDKCNRAGFSCGKQQNWDQGSKAGSSVVSNRIEELYRSHVNKLRSRPSSDREEKAIRQRNVDEREMKGFTFKPRTQWGRGRSTNLSKRAFHYGPEAPVPEPPNDQVVHISPLRTPLRKDFVDAPLDPPLPREIIVTTTIETNIRSVIYPHSRTARRSRLEDLPVRTICVERRKFCLALETGSI